MTVTQTGELTGAGGVRLFTQSWLPDDGAPPARAAIVIAHGLGEHSGRYEAVAQRLVDAGYAVWALDHRGHGRSAGPRERFAVADVVADLGAFIDEVRATSELPVTLLGHSFGGLVAVRCALTHGDRLDGLVLSGALAGIDTPAAVRAAGRLVARLAPGVGLIKLDPRLVSRDPAVVADYRADPLVHHGRIPAATAVELVDAITPLEHEVGTITVPALILYGTADGLCPPWGSIMLGERIGSADVTIRAYEGLYHEILNEPECETVLDDVLQWLQARVGRAATRDGGGTAGHGRA